MLMPTQTEKPPWVILYDQKHTAKKDHKCTWCSKLIRKGEKYRRVSYQDGDKFKCDKIHLSHFVV